MKVKSAAVFTICRRNDYQTYIVEIFADNMEMLTPRTASQQQGGYMPQAASQPASQQPAANSSVTDDLPF